MKRELARRRLAREVRTVGSAGGETMKRELARSASKVS